MTTAHPRTPLNKTASRVIIDLSPYCPAVSLATMNLHGKTTLRVTEAQSMAKFAVAK
jgi:hypothetical protein